jgi:protein TonB
MSVAWIHPESMSMGGRATALPAAAIITLALFYAMTTLIRTDDAQIIETTPAPTISIVREIRDEPPVVQKRPPKPDRVEKPPVVEVKQSADPFGGSSELTFAGPGVDDRSTWKPSVGAAGAEGDAVPLVTSPPEYPARAIQRGIEGWVIVEFSIDPLGRVFDARVIEGQPSGIFESAALKAIARYKYKPKVLNGEGVPVSGVRQRILFELDS